MNRFQKPTSRHRSSFSIRRADLLDLDAITEVAVLAMPKDPQWSWRFPGRLLFPEDHRLATRQKFEEFLTDESGAWLLFVAEKRSKSKPQVVAFALWNVQNSVLWGAFPLPGYWHPDCRFCKSDGTGGLRQTWFSASLCSNHAGQGRRGYRSGGYGVQATVHEVCMVK